MFYISCSNCVIDESDCSSAPPGGTCPNEIFTDTGEQCDLGTGHPDADWVAAHCNKPGDARQCQCMTGYGTVGECPEKTKRST